MLKIYDLYGNQLGLIVGEYERELLLWLGQHSIEELDPKCIDFDKVELRCGKNLHILSRSYKIDKATMKKKLCDWWSKKYPDIDFSYHLAVIYHNISKRDWTGFNLLQYVDSGVFTLFNYRYLAPKQKLPLDRGDFPQGLGRGKYLATVVNSYPNVVTCGKAKAWDDAKKESSVYTHLSLESGGKLLNKKLPYFVYTKKGDKLLLEITEDSQVPSVFVGGVKYSYM